MKTCRICEESLPLSAFETRTDTGRINTACRECRCREKRKNFHATKPGAVGLLGGFPVWPGPVDRSVPLRWAVAA